MKKTKEEKVSKTKKDVKKPKQKIEKKTKQKIEINDLPFDISDIFDEEEKLSHLSSTNITSSSSLNKLSTGVLPIDLILGGGLTGNWYEIVGPESGGKTTLLYSILGEAIKNIPNQIKALLLDVEGVMDFQWFQNITGINNLDKVFGKRDDSGNWIYKSQLRYYKPANGEAGLKLIKQILKRMPNKIQIKDTWYYEYVPVTTKAGLKTNPSMGFKKLQGSLKNQYNKKLLNKTGNFCIPIKNNYSGVELIIGIDSLAAMTPEAIAEGQNAGDAMSVQARMFSKHINDLKSLVTKKFVGMIALNQIREKPGMVFGSREYSPGGHTLKHAADTRLRLGSVAVPTGGQVKIEGENEYRYFKVRTPKNKLFIPLREALVRWWVGHKGKSGFGPDPVMNVYSYLLETGQLAFEKKDKFTILLKNKKLKDKTFSFKSLSEHILSNTKPDILNICRKQLKSGKGIKKYIKNIEIVAKKGLN